MRTVYLTILVLLLSTAASMAQVAVIAHQSCPADTIEKRELLDFYTGDILKWSDGQLVVVFDLKPRGEVKKDFYKFLGKSASRMKSIWLKKMLAGEKDPPLSLKSETEILDKVATTPGALGFVSQALVTQEVKILAVIRADD